MYFKVKLLMWHYYKVHFLKVYLNVLRNINVSFFMSLKWSFILLILYNNNNNNNTFYLYSAFPGHKDALQCTCNKEKIALEG